MSRDCGAAAFIAGWILLTSLDRCVGWRCCLHHRQQNLALQSPREHDKHRF